MASRKRALYCLGVMTVGPPGLYVPPAGIRLSDTGGLVNFQQEGGSLPRKAVSLTQLSSRLSHV